MPTLDELVYSTLETVYGGKISDDSTISLELVQFFWLNNRSKLIREDQGKGRSLSNNIVQTLPCVPVIEVDASECCDIQTGCTMYRTEEPLPKFIELYQKDLITKVSGVDVMAKGWNIIPYHRALYAGSSRWTKDTTKVFLKNNYIYIMNPPAVLSKISISGVFEDPRDAAQFANCEGTPCYNDEMEFPISTWMIPIIQDMILKNDMRIIAANMQDERGNEKNDPNASQR